LTPEQIRLVNRLTKNITVLFDGDAAGLRASLRGIDLILEQGMNVKVCTFPEGEDPDSFARKNAYEDLELYLQENAKDFIQFKASLLVRESQNDPIKKADTIRDIINSISKIPDRIQREVYIQECSRIMDISEEVLFNTLAQIGKKELQEAGKAQRQNQKAFEVVRNDNERFHKVDELEELERKIIQLLLLYGNNIEEFQDLVLKKDDKEELILEPEVYKAKVFEKIYLDLQQDEVELSNLVFRKIYSELIVKLNEETDFSIETFVNEAEPDIANEITSILMDEEKYRLHDWERKNIFVKQKENLVSPLVSETILNFRCYLIGKRVNELQEQTLE